MPYLEPENIAQLNQVCGSTMTYVNRGGFLGNGGAVIMDKTNLTPANLIAKQFYTKGKNYSEAIILLLMPPDV